MPTLDELGVDISGEPTLSNIGEGARAMPMPTWLDTIDQLQQGRARAMADPNYRSRVTFYAPGPGDRMEGGFETSRPNPVTGRAVPFTLDDVRLGRAPFVTVASDPSRYGQSVNLGDITYRSPIDRLMYTLQGVRGLVHDTGSAFRGRPDKLDVAVGDFRGFSAPAASAFVGQDPGTKLVSFGPGEAATGGWQTTVSPAAEGVGYVAPSRVAQGATTRPEDLQPQDSPSFLQKFMRALGKTDFTMPAPVAVSTTPATPPSIQLSPIGRASHIGRIGGTRAQDIYGR